MIISTKYLITGDGKTVLTDKAVYIGEDGKIGKIAPKEEPLKEFRQEEVKEYGDATLLPGLMDMHAHLAYGYSQPDSFNYGAQLIMLYALQHAQAAFERGITTVRDMSSAHGVCKNLKLAEKKGFIVIPRIVHTDTGICMTGGHAWDEVEEADGPWAIRKEIRKQVRDGAEWVKILTTNRESYPEFTQEELDAAVDECHRRGIKCGVHAGTNPGIQMCIDAGFDTIEHGTFMTLDHAKQMAEKGIAWTPTIMAYTYLYELCKENIELRGTEVKSIRAGTLNLKDSYCVVKNGEAMVYSMHISPYDKGNIFNHDPDRPKRLLLHKREINKLHALVKQDGYALIPLSVYFKDARVKVELGVCKGKKNYDKREASAQRDAKREIDRHMKNYR